MTPASSIRSLFTLVAAQLLLELAVSAGLAILWAGQLPLVSGAMAGAFLGALGVGWRAKVSDPGEIRRLSRRSAFVHALLGGIGETLGMLVWGGSSPLFPFVAGAIMAVAMGTVAGVFTQTGLIMASRAR